jgi:hypothetical protein
MEIGQFAANSKVDVDNIVLEEAVRGVASLVERLEGQLRSAIGDNQQTLVLAEQLQTRNKQVCSDIISQASLKRRLDDRAGS